MSPGLITLVETALLCLLTWPPVIFMLRDPRPRVVPPAIAFDVPDYTFDTKGFT